MPRWELTITGQPVERVRHLYHMLSRDDNVHEVKWAKSGSDAFRVYVHFKQGQEKPFTSVLQHLDKLYPDNRLTWFERLLD